MLGKFVHRVESSQAAAVSVRLCSAIGAGRREQQGAVFTSKSILRASSLSKWCPREILLLAESGVALTSVDAGEDAWNLAMGKAIHFAFQHELFDFLGGGIFQGWWSVKSDEGVSRIVVGNDLVGRCQTPQWVPRPDPKAQYFEMSMLDKEYGISGHCDGVLVWNDRTEVLEIKSIGKFAYRLVDPDAGGRPMPKHVVQCNLYMWLLGLQHARLLYVRKDGLGLSDSMLEYELTYDEKLVRPLLDSIMQVRRELAAWEAAPMQSRPVLVLPSRVSGCDRKSSTRAKDCGMADRCWKR
jgi:hypothetical protein